jgi:anti-sigma regulatory factor (Ser/Thr protein kinase)
MKTNTDSGNETDSFSRKIALTAAVDNLEQLLDWVSEILEAENYPSKLCSQIAVVTEELFVNIASYAYREEIGEAVISMGFDKSLLTIQFEDSGIAFNPLENELPDTCAGIADRKIGGLGIYIVRKLMDEIHYQRIDGKNILTIKKKVAAAPKA